MSRRWKKPNQALPGWGQYRTPLRAGSSPKNPFRAWKKRKAKRQRIYREVHRRVSPVAFPAKVTPVLGKILRIEKEGVCHESRWRRAFGKWTCFYSPQPFDWFTRINHPDLVHSWLLKNGFEFRWLPVDRSQPGECPAVAEQACVSKESNTALRHQLKTAP